MTCPETFPHAVHKLYQYRKSISTRPFNARGAGVTRCEYCRIDIDHCICPLVKPQSANASFALLMYDDEVLKPSNTGRLIADILPDTKASLWHRTQVCEQFKSLLNDPHYQPILIFPDEYAVPEQPLMGIDELEKLGVEGKQRVRRPLFILLDATWRQARKMYRKSPYLHHIPMLSVPAQLMTREPESAVGDITDGLAGSRYHVRTAHKEQQLATAEVAARVLQLSGNQRAGDVLNLWFDVFSYRYQCGVKQPNLGDKSAVQRYQQYLQQHP
ncbi:tRNA-uridine aminocarboxypropyltransferase [Thalassotalea mangrovi]|uniref:tRNA-uridine aminocarboxypropyltransferase n=1 Tax=Thalassotalea mangrovi TaxID=2572245 RepID=A0A4U1B3X0_9GAMM|nr:DTW domain-containing protein [Thalassotalea mangrovi]TKB44099.1 DTW domain-containing protein [Thalassotalea mangrovi]